MLDFSNIETDYNYYYAISTLIGGALGIAIGFVGILAGVILRSSIF